MLRTTPEVTAKIKWNILCNEFRVVTSTQHILAYYYYYYSCEVFSILTVIEMLTYDSVKIPSAYSFSNLRKVFDVIGTICE